MPDYGFSVWDVQAIYATGRTGSESSSKNTPEQDESDAEGSREDGMKIVEVHMAVTVDANSVKNVTALSVRVSDVSVYHEVDLLCEKRGD